MIERLIEIQSIFLPLLITCTATIMLAGMMACVSQTFQHFGDAGMIFSPYFKLLSMIREHKKLPLALRLLAKPLGLCIYCLNTWVNILFIVAFWSLGIIDFGLLPLLGYTILQASVSNVILYYIHYN